MTATRPGGAWLWLGLPLLAGEAGLLFAFAARGLPPRSYLLDHLGLCLAAALIAALWAGLARRGERAGRLAPGLQLVLWALLAGPFGAIAALALLGSGPAAPPDDPPDDTQGPVAPFDRLERLHGAVLDGRLREPGAHRVRALVDVLAGGGRAEKFDALNVISRRYTPAAAPLLKRALADPDASVRVLAATVIARQHDVHTRRIGALQTRAAAAPDGSREGWAELAEARLAYAESGLLDSARADAERASADADLAQARPAHAD
jgi:hypothetical protein